MHVHSYVIAVTGVRPCAGTPIRRARMRHHSQRVLLVEPDGATASRLCASIRAAGYQCSRVGRGDEARQALSDTAYDAIVADAELPDGDALGLLASLGSDRPLRAVLVSGRMTHGLAVCGRRAGFDACIATPAVCRCTLASALEPRTAKSGARWAACSPRGRRGRVDEWPQREPASAAVSTHPDGR